MSEDTLYEQFKQAILKDCREYIDKKYRHISVFQRYQIYKSWKQNILDERLTDMQLEKMDEQIKNALQ